jgi:hypothetical protein
MAEVPEAPEVPVCNVCAAPLRPGARFCTECKNFQGRVRRALSSLNLQALVAIVPVIALAFVFVKDQFIQHGSDIRASVRACTNKTVTLVATNLGDRAAVLKSARVWLDRGGSEPNENDIFALVPKDSKLEPEQAFQFEPQKLKFVVLRVVGRLGTDASLPRPESGKCTYRLSIDFIAFDHKPNRVDATCDCAATGE